MAEATQPYQPAHRRRHASVGLARGLTLDHLWIVTVLGLVWLFVSILPLPPNDLWWHMAAGRTMVTTGSLIRTNEWAYTLPREAPYIYQSWLSELVLYGLWRLGGVPLLTLARSVVIIASYGLVSWHAWRRVRNGKAIAIAVLLAALVGWDNWTLRPQTLALLPGAVFVAVLGEYLDRRASARWLLVLPAIMVLWVNLHGSFVLGVGLLGLAWLALLIDVFRAARAARAQAWRRLRACAYGGAATALAILVNPLGFGIVGYVRNLVGNTTVQTNILEWMPPSNRFALASPGFWFFALLLLLAALMGVAARRPSPVDVLWYWGMGWLAIGSVRHVMWFALTMIPLAAQQLSSLMASRPVRAGRAFAAMYSVLVGAMIVATLPWFEPSRYLASEHLYAASGPSRHLLSNTTPVGAVEWLAEHRIDGRFWTDMTYTSYTIWELPEKQIFADLRIELFSPEIWDDYFSIAVGDAQSLALLDKWRITYLLLDREWQPALHSLLLRTPGWCERYSDSRSAIIARCG